MHGSREEKRDSRDSDRDRNNDQRKEDRRGERRNDDRTARSNVKDTKRDHGGRHDERNPRDDRRDRDDRKEGKREDRREDRKEHKREERREDQKGGSREERRDNKGRIEDSRDRRVEKGGRDDSRGVRVEKREERKGKSEENRDERKDRSTTKDRRQEKTETKPDTNKSIKDSALDFFSESFDPLKALYAKSIQPPLNVKPFDNISKFRSLLPPGDSNYVAKPKKTDAKPDSSEQDTVDTTKLLPPKKEPNTTTEPQETKPAVPERTIIEKMTSFKAGPLNMLTRFLSNKSRVRVLIRSARDTRGICVGYLQVFDRQMNLVMRDVEEEFVCWRYVDPETNQELERVPKSAEYSASTQDEETEPKDMEPTTETLPENTNESGDTETEKKEVETIRKEREPPLTKRLFYKKRHFNQLFIKGDNVVYVCEAPHTPNSLPNFYELCKNKYVDLL